MRAQLFIDPAEDPSVWIPYIAMGLLALLILWAIGSGIYLLIHGRRDVTGDW